MAGPRVLLLPRDLMALGHIARNLRERDRAEIFACGPETPDELAFRTYAAGEFQWVAWRDGRPVASIGAAPLWPNVWSVWAYGTDDWPGVVLTLTRHVRRGMIPALVEAGVHRAQCAALATHEDARRWLTSLGARAEGVLRAYGRNGEDFVMFAWGLEDVRT